MFSLRIIRIDKRISDKQDQHLSDLHASILVEEQNTNGYQQQVMDTIYKAISTCQKTLEAAMTEAAAETERLEKDVFANLDVRKAIERIYGMEADFAGVVYADMEEVLSLCRAGQLMLDVFEEDLRKEWKDMRKAGFQKRREVVMNAEKTLVKTIGDHRKLREKVMKESRELDAEMKNLEDQVQKCKEGET